MSAGPAGYRLYPHVERCTPATGAAYGRAATAWPGGPRLTTSFTGRKVGQRTSTTSYIANTTPSRAPSEISVGCAWVATLGSIYAA